jgi:hypothetical protein
VPKPAVSVIVSKKNSEDDLSSVLKTIQAQTFSDFEILIAGQQRNLAAKHAQGEYLAFAEPDQRWMPSKLEKQMITLGQNAEISWCYCDAFLAYTQSRCGESMRLHAGNILRPLLVKNFIPPGSVVLRRAVFEALGGFDESGRYLASEDWELWIRVAAEHPIALAHEPLISVALAGPDSEQRQSSMKRVVESAVARHQERLKDLRSESLAEICMSAGNARLRANQRDEARLHFEEALTHAPLRSDAYLSWVSSFLSSEAQQQIRDLHNLGRQLQKTDKTKAAEKMDA